MALIAFAILSTIEGPTVPPELAALFEHGRTFEYVLKARFFDCYEHSSAKAKLSCRVANRRVTEETVSSEVLCTCETSYYSGCTRLLDRTRDPISGHYTWGPDGLTRADSASGHSRTLVYAPLEPGRIKREDDCWAGAPVDMECFDNARTSRKTVKAGRRSVKGLCQDTWTTIIFSDGDDPGPPPDRHCMAAGYGFTTISWSPNLMERATLQLTSTTPGPGQGQ